MEEKKLTDEEIVSALICCSIKPTACAICPLSGASASDCSELIDGALDLINRLQSENAEQKAEIERLEDCAKIADEDINDISDGWADSREENAKLKKEIERYQAVNKLLEMDIKDLHKEREKRVEEVHADFMKDYNIMRGDLKELYDENAELQKQVNELKGDYVKGYEAGVDEGWDNAVEETAKDILKFAKPFIDIKEFISACAEVWGVEVEG